MTDMVLLPIVLLGVLSQDRTYATPIATYAEPAECLADLPAVSVGYLPEFPDAVFWCANPIGRVAAPTPAPAGAMATSPRPKPRPENLENNGG